MSFFSPTLPLPEPFKCRAICAPCNCLIVNNLRPFSSMCLLIAWLCSLPVIFSFYYLLNIFRSRCVNGDLHSWEITRNIHVQEAQRQGMDFSSLLSSSPILSKIILCCRWGTESSPWLALWQGSEPATSWNKCKEISRNMQLDIRQGWVSSVEDHGFNSLGQWWK